MTDYTICKDCYKLDTLRRKRTVSGMITEIYAHQKEASIKRGHKIPLYTKKEFKEWMLSQYHLTELHESWKSSGYDSRLTPSVFRIDKAKGFSLDNIELKPWCRIITKKHNGTNMNLI